MKKPWRQYASSACALTIANLVPLFGVIYLGWETTDILFIYWFESVIIGVFNVVKMLLTKTIDQEKGAPTTNTPPPKLLKYLIILFFILHYGVFILACGFFLLLFFFNQPDSVVQNPLSAMPFIIGLALKLKFALFSLALSHGLSFVTNFMLKKEGQGRGEKDFAFNPYDRIMNMIVVITLCSWFTIITNKNIFALVGLIVLKTATDLRGHFEERKKFTSPAKRSP